MKSHVTFITPVLLALALGACATTPKGPAALKAADYASILSDPKRTDADKKDDAARKPAEVLEFAQIRPGDTVLEIEVGRGWFTEILSKAVGKTGKVITQNPAEFAYSGPALATRRAAGELPNVTETTSHFDKLSAADASVDRVVWLLGPHELYYVPKDSTGLGDPTKAYAEIARVLKPGGLFVAMDHAANVGAPMATGGTLHRIDPNIVLKMALGTGFKLDAKSDLLANPSDDRSKLVFDPTVRRHTDQFLFRFRKGS